MSACLSACVYCVCSFCDRRRVRWCGWGLCLARLVTTSATNCFDRHAPPRVLDACMRDACSKCTCLVACSRARRARVARARVLTAQHACVMMAGSGRRGAAGGDAPGKHSRTRASSSQSRSRCRTRCGPPPYILHPSPFFLHPTPCRPCTLHPLHPSAR